MEKNKRPSLDEYFMKMAHLAASRSTCQRRNVGAVIVKDKRVLSTGYNGAPKGLPHCEEVGCLRENLDVPTGERHELCRGVHAEQNAIIQAAVFGTSIKDGKIYTTNHPCVVCAKLLINASIKEIVYDDEYIDSLAKDVLSQSEVTVRRFKLKEKD
ncbi:MAG: cytidine/deoxycytidylate deaminase family protein [Methanomassiliicoccales archaeon]|nr:MAG: cytidine/deoxycytidylate deaminase family protein [Methanomassiliicoccales archaeon]